MKTTVLCATNGKSQAQFANFPLAEEERQGQGVLGQGVLEQVNLGECTWGSMESAQIQRKKEELGRVWEEESDGRKETKCK